MVLTDSMGKKGLLHSKALTTAWLKDCSTLKISFKFQDHCITEIVFTHMDAPESTVKVTSMLTATFPVMSSSNVDLFHLNRCTTKIKIPVYTIQKHFTLQKRVHGFNTECAWCTSVYKCYQGMSFLALNINLQYTKQVQ